LFKIFLAAGKVPYSSRLWIFSHVVLISHVFLIIWHLARQLDRVAANIISFAHRVEFKTSYALSCTTRKSIRLG
jgi:hypothetical protein